MDDGKVKKVIALPTESKDEALLVEANLINGQGKSQKEEGGYKIIIEI